jgi:hypothetical protein
MHAALEKLRAEKKELEAQRGGMDLKLQQASGTTAGCSRPACTVCSKGSMT